MMTPQPIAPDLFESDPEPHLVGGRHRETGVHVFPLPDGNERPAYDRVALSRTGTIWSHTIQRFPPKSPPYAGAGPFEPYAVGYVELPGQVIVEGRLIGLDHDAWRTGMTVETVVTTFAHADGTTRSLYAFAPVSKSGEAA